MKTTFTNIDEVIVRANEIFAEGKRVKVEPAKEHRTLDQNRLYWLWLTCIESETGNDKNDLHEYFKQRYLHKYYQHIKLKNRYTCFPTVQTTTILDTKQFADYLEKIQVFANTELGIILPNPEDQHFAEFYNHYKDMI